MVAKGTFREDLLYRIYTIHIEIPPLRERGNDILQLAESFLRKYGSKYSKGQLYFTKDTQSKLLEYSWPGNVRELQHAIEKAVIMCDEETLKPCDFFFKPNNEVPANSSKTLEEMEKEMICKAIEHHHGNISAIASQLGITRQTLYNKMKKFGL